MTKAIATLTISISLLFFPACGQSNLSPNGAAPSQTGASPRVDGNQLSALEIAYKAGVLKKEEFDAKKRELDRTATPQGPTVAGWQSGWERHRNPAGFEIEHPAGWAVQALGQMRIVVRSPDGRSIAAITPFVRARGGCREYVKEAFDGQSGATPFPQAVIENAAQRRQQPDEVVAGLTLEGGSSRGAVLCSLDRGSGMLFVIAAPAAQYEQQKAGLVRTVKSLHFGSPTGQSDGPRQQVRRPLQYSRWTDPSEGAFFLDVPTGWRVAGGLVRRSNIDLTGSVKMSSPDGASAIFLGDERLYNCVTPGVVGGSMKEGETYRNQATALVVLRYQPPLTFASNYLGELQRTYGLSGIQVRDQHQPPPENSGTFRVSYVELSFTAQRNGRQMAGLLADGISVNPVQGGQYWTPGVAGFISPIEDAGQIMTAFRHSIATGQKGPVWARRQGETTVATSKAFTASSANTSDAISKSYWARQQSSDRSTDRSSADRSSTNYSDAQRDQVRLRDPNAGEEFTATSGHNYYYRPAAGDERHVFGTDNTDRPNIDATELLRVR